jgi:hypothetical protein
MVTGTTSNGAGKMSESKHTEGPWVWVEDTSDGYERYMLAYGVLHTWSTVGTPWGDEIDKANAKIIEAAPELFEAVKLQLELDLAGIMNTPAERIAEIKRKQRYAFIKAGGKL